MNNKSNNNNVYHRGKRINRKTVVLVQKIILLFCLFFMIIMSIMLIFSKITSLHNTESQLSVKGQTIDLRNENQSDIQENSTVTTTQKSSDFPWYLTLVNADNPMDDDYRITLTRLRNKQAIAPVAIKSFRL